MSTTTRISDAFVPDRWLDWMQKDTTEKTAIFTSGILRSSAEMSALLNGGGRTMNMPFWKDLGNSEPGIASDDPAVESTPEKLTSGKDVFRRQVRTHSISVADLTPVLSGGDPMSRLREAESRYWERHFQRTLVHTLTGIFADNAANDSSDMINDISNDSSASVTSAELISAEAVMDTAQLMGDNKDVFTTLIMHSAVETRLAKLNLIDYIRDSEGNVRVKTYLGYKVVTDDNVRRLTVAAGETTNRTKYWTYLAGPGSVAWAEAALPNGAEMKREPAQGNGMGVEVIYTRRQYAMHVPGIKWTDSQVAGEFPSYADLKAAANWDRVYAERKQIPIAALVTNG
jgi:hypothetical protein